jgi:hypothetical protein
MAQCHIPVVASTADNKLDTRGIGVANIQYSAWKGLEFLALDVVTY